VNKMILLVVGAALNWLNTLLWLVFWLGLNGRYWQGVLLVLGFAVAAALTTFLLYRDYRRRGQQQTPFFVVALLIVFGLLWLLVLLAGPGG
jgi:hypothetical protein